MKEEYISISEFAKRAGVSHQAIYKRLNKDLQPWLQVASGKKSLNIRALELFEGENFATVSTEVAAIQALTKELDFKNREIEQLSEENKRLSEQLLALSDKVGTTLQTITQTQLADKMIEGKKMIDEKTTAAADEPTAAVAEPEPKKKKRLFWK